MFSKLNYFQLSQNPSSHDLEDAPDKPPTKFVTIIVLISFILIFGLIALSFPVTEKLSSAREDLVNSGMGNSKRIVYLSNQKQLLSSYKKIDENNFQIPIQQAMSIIVKTQGNVFNNIKDKKQ